MLIRPYQNYTEDFAGVQELLKSHDMPESLMGDIPNFGLVAIKDNKIIAYGGLRTIEGQRALFDSYITLSDAKSEDRDRALDLITYKLIRIAKANDIKQLLAISTEPNIQSRCDAFGFTSFKNAYLQLANL